MEETYTIILIIAILILILYFVNFSGKTIKVNNDIDANQINVKQYKPYNPTENFGSCRTPSSTQPSTQPSTHPSTQTTQTKATLKVHIAHWCGWSKKLLAHLNSDEFKNKFKDVENICILEIIDCEVNREKCDPSIVKGFPTIILQSKSGKMIPYNGNRSTDDIITFIKANSS